MSIIKPEKLKDASALLEDVINEALSKHPVDDGILRVDVSHVTQKFTPEKCDQLADVLCQRIEHAGYHPYFMTYFTFFTHINVYISFKPIQRVYWYMDTKTGEAKSDRFIYKMPYYGFISEEAMKQQYSSWNFQKMVFRAEHEGKAKAMQNKNKSFFSKLFGR